MTSGTRPRWTQTLFHSKPSQHPISVLWPTNWETSPVVQCEGLWVGMVTGVTGNAHFVLASWLLRGIWTEEVYLELLLIHCGLNGSFRQFNREIFPLWQRVQKRPICFLNSSERSLGVGGSNPSPRLNQLFMSKGLDRCDWTFIWLCPARLRMANQIHLHEESKSVILIDDSD